MTKLRNRIITNNNLFVLAANYIEIGDNSIISAGAVVISSFPANVIIGGAPAKILKQKPEWGEA